VGQLFLGRVKKNFFIEKQILVVSPIFWSVVSVGGHPKNDPSQTEIGVTPPIKVGQIAYFCHFPIFFSCIFIPPVVVTFQRFGVRLDRKLCSLSG